MIKPLSHPQRLIDAFDRAAKNADGYRELEYVVGLMLTAIVRECGGEPPEKWEPFAPPTITRVNLPPWKDWK